MIKKQDASLSARTPHVMWVSLWSDKTFDLSPLQELLRVHRFLAWEDRPGARPDNHIRKTRVVITQNADLEYLNRILRKIRQSDGDTKLLVCAPKLGYSDKQYFSDSIGPLQFISPPYWDLSAVCDRVLGQLFLERGSASVYGFFCGETKVIQDCLKDIDQLGRFREPILVTGERGTGKELCAKLLHQRRNEITKHEKNTPLVPINCATLGTDMLEEELFGHVRGAFIGADRDRPGLFKTAGKGSLFLDEIGELPTASQAKLLRVLEDQTIRPVGSDTTSTIRARFILATNRNLDKECKQGSFKSEFHDRIKGMTIAMPTLRERMADIPLLVDFFVKEFNASNQTAVKLPWDMDSLYSYEWYGNVRELRSVIYKAAAFSEPEEPLDNTVLDSSVTDLIRQSEGRNPPRSEFMVAFNPDKDSWKEFQERAWETYSQTLLMKTKNDTAQAAELAGMSRSRFYARQAKHKTMSHHGNKTDEFDPHPMP